MPRLIAALLRHGEYRQLPETPSALQPFPLTDKGREQARRAAGALLQMAREMRCSIDTELHSSRLLRAWESATLIAEKQGQDDKQAFRGSRTKRREKTKNSSKYLAKRILPIT